MPAIAAIRTSARHIFFATETDAATAAIATAYLHPHTINEIGHDTHSLDYKLQLHELVPIGTPQRPSPITRYANNGGT